MTFYNAYDKIILVMKVKKVIKIFLCMSLLFILSSCGNKEEENLNYTTSEVDGKTIYTIKTKKYVSSDAYTKIKTKMPKSKALLGFGIDNILSFICYFLYHFI